MARVHDYDWLVIGSGFGWSVSALWLAEKGYRVAVLTITALAENAMSHIPDNPAVPHLPPKVDVAPAPIHVASA